MTYQCPYCHKVLKMTEASKLQRHYTTCKEFVQHVHHANDGTKQCTLCGRHFKNQQGIYNHLGNAHFQDLVKNDSLTEECQICDEPFQAKSKHVELCAKYNHYIEKWNNRWRCTRCDKVTDKQVGMFMHHIRNHEKQDLNEAIFDETRKLGIEQVVQKFEKDQPGQQVHPERSSTQPMGSISSTPSSTPLQFFGSSKASTSSPEPLKVFYFPELNTEEESNHSFSYLDEHDPQPSTSQGLQNNVQQPEPSNDEDDDSDIECLGSVVEVKPKVGELQSTSSSTVTSNAMSNPKFIELGSPSTSSSQAEQSSQQHQPMERLEIEASAENVPSVQDNPDTRNDLFIDEIDNEEVKTSTDTADEGFVGVISKVYDCIFCEKHFKTQANVIDHLKKHHKIPKNHAKLMRVKHL